MTTHILVSSYCAGAYVKKEPKEIRRKKNGNDEKWLSCRRRRTVLYFVSGLNIKCHAQDLGIVVSFYASMCLLLLFPTKLFRDCKKYYYERIFRVLLVRCTVSLRRVSIFFQTDNANTLHIQYTLQPSVTDWVSTNDRNILFVKSFARR